MYIPILFPGCATPQWALVDSGAQVSLITTGCATYCNLVESGFTNVLASDLTVGGVSGASWQTARLTTTAILGTQRLAGREMDFSFALQPGERYKIIIGMDIIKEHKLILDFNTDCIKFKGKNDEKVHLKLTPRKVVFRTKQIKDYFDYIRKGRAITKAQTNEVQEEEITLDSFDQSCLEVDEVTAQYVGEELTHVAALAALPPGLPDSPLDADEPADIIKDPDFAISCQLATKMTGKVQPGGKQITFRVKEHQITAIVENHAVANVDVLFHEEGEECASKHLHKIGVNGVKAKTNLQAVVMEMMSLTREMGGKQRRVKIRNAAVHSLLT